MDEGVAVPGDKLDVADRCVNVGGRAADGLARLEAELLGRDVGLFSIGRLAVGQVVRDVAGRRDDAHVAVLGLDGGEIHVAARNDADIARRRLGRRAVRHRHVAALRLDVGVARRRRDVALLLAVDILLDARLREDRRVLACRHRVI